MSIFHPVVAAGDDYSLLPIADIMKGIRFLG